MRIQIYKIISSAPARTPYLWRKMISLNSTPGVGQSKSTGREARPPTHASLSFQGPSPVSTTDHKAIGGLKRVIKPAPSMKCTTSPSKRMQGLAKVRKKRGNKKAPTLLPPHLTTYSDPVGSCCLVPSPVYGLRSLQYHPTSPSRPARPRTSRTRGRPTACFRSMASSSSR